MKSYTLLILCYMNLKNECAFECATKNIPEIYLDRALALRAVNNWFIAFRKGHFVLNDKLRPW